MVAFYYDTFFSCLSLQLQSTGAYEDIWIKGLEIDPWARDACSNIAEVAKVVAKKMRGGDIPTADWLYSQFQCIEIPRDIHHSSEGGFCRYFQRALIEIAFDLHLLVDKKSLDQDQLQTIISAKHFRKELWLDYLIDQRAKNFLSAEALDYLCAVEERELFSTIKQFNERYEDYMRIAQISTLNGNGELAEKFARLGIQDALAVNFHKDHFLFGLSDIVLDCAKAGIPDVKDWLHRLGPFIDQVTDITDGDETDHVQVDFGETLLHVEPTRFPAFYKRYIDEHEWYRSDNMLSRFVNAVDRDDPINKAIVETYSPRKERNYSSSSEDEEPEESIDVSAFPPDQLDAFFDALTARSRIGNMDEFQCWFDYWSDQTGRKPAILQAMQSELSKDSHLPFRVELFHQILVQLTLEVSGRDAAFPALLRAHSDGYGWSMHGNRTETNKRFQMVATHWPEKWLDFIKSTALSDKAYSRAGHSPSIGFSRLVRYLLTLGHQDIVVEIGNMLVGFTLARAQNMDFPESPWVEAPENGFGFIPLLFERIDWPEVEVRERTCRIIAERLLNDETREIIKEYYWQWLKTRVFESQSVTAIVLFYRSRLLEKQVFDDRDLQKLIDNIPAPSALSWKLIEEVSGGIENPEPDYSSLHSGNCVPDYTVPDYFTDYKRSLLPPIHDMHAETLQEKGAVGFRRQWAYEVECLYERESIDARYPYAHYFIDRAIPKRVAIFDLPQAEVFRSAYIRALAWAFDRGYIKKGEMIFHALSFCPVEFCSWQAGFAGTPDSWPVIPANEESLDRTPEQVFQLIEDTLLNKGDGTILGFASAPVSVCFDKQVNIESFYDLTIHALLQKNIERDDEIKPEEIAEQLRRLRSAHNNRLASTLAGPLSQVNIDDYMVGSGGTIFVPVVVSLRSDPIARWQSKQMYRGIKIAAPYIAEQQPLLQTKEKKLQVTYDDTILSETVFWAFDQLDFWPEDLPPGLGVCTMVSAERTQRLCEENNVTLCWLAQLNFYMKNSESDTYLEEHFYKFFGLSQIILPE